MAVKTQGADPPDPNNDPLTSEDLAALIIDALRVAKLVQEEHVERAMQIAVEEIEVRRTLGDLILA